MIKLILNFRSEYFESDKFYNFVNRTRKEVHFGKLCVSVTAVRFAYIIFNKGLVPYSFIDITGVLEEKWYKYIVYLPPELILQPDWIEIADIFFFYICSSIFIY